jgi:hypothetical protein
MSDFNPAGGIIGVAFIILAAIVLFLWIFLPFAIFGTKNILRDILAELRRQNDHAGAPPIKPPAATEY